MRGGPRRRRSGRCSDRKPSGPVNMPTLEILAVGGLSYTRLHCATLRSPPRRTLLTGLNPQWVGLGRVTQIATSTLRRASWTGCSSPSLA